MAYIKPKLSFISNSESVTTDPGPSSFALSLATTPTADTSGRLTVDNMIQGKYTTTTTPVEFLGKSGHDLMSQYNATDIWTPGTDGCFLYLKNMDTSGTDSIYVGIVSNCDDNASTATGTDAPLAPDTTGQSGLAETTNITLRTMTLKPGEFAFFPWDYTGRIFCQNNAGDPILEWWLFNRPA